MYMKKTQLSLFKSFFATFSLAASLLKEEVACCEQVIDNRTLKPG